MENGKKVCVFFIRGKGSQIVPPQGSIEENVNEKGEVVGSLLKTVTSSWEKEKEILHMSLCKPFSPFSPTYKILLLSQYIINLSKFLSHVNFFNQLFFPFNQ